MGTIANLIAGFNPSGFAAENQQREASIAQTQAQTLQEKQLTQETAERTRQANLENQMRERALKDQDIQRRAYVNTDGTPTGIRDYMLKNGASVGAIQAYQAHDLDMRTKLATLTKEQKANEAATHGQVGGILGSLRSLSSEDRIAAIPGAIANLSQIDPSHPWSPEQLADDKSLDATIGAHGAAGAYLGLKKEAATIAGEEGKEKRAVAMAPFEQSKVEFDAERAEQQVKGETPEQKLAQQKFEQELTDFSEKVRHNKADEHETARYHNMTVEGVSLSPQAKDKMAEMFAVTGVLPAFGMGAAAARNRSEVINKAAEKFPNVDFATNQAAFQANKSSLKTLQTASDRVDAFEQTAGKNIDIFLNAAKDIVDIGSPLLNSPVRMLSDKVFGSEKMSAFRAARETALTEAAKVLESPTGGSSLTVSGRDAVKTLSDPNATLGQQVASMKVLRQDMANRKQSNVEQINAINDRIKSANPNSKPAAPAAAVQEWTRDKDGKIVKK